MSKKTTWIIVGAVVLVAIVAGVLVATNTSSNSGNGHSQNAGRTATQASNSSSGNMSDMSSTAVATDTVQIKDYMFDPMSITVKVGTTVTWTNKDAVGHTVTADNPSGDSPSSQLLAQGESYKFTFTKAGTYSVHCNPHPYMKQTITVTE